MGMDISILGSLAGATAGGGFLSLLRVYLIRPGEVTVGRTYHGTPPPEWGVPSARCVVRPTGGGAVLHGQDVCFSLLMSARPRMALVDLYSILHLFLGRFVRDLGHETSLGGKPENPHDGRGICFREPVCGDLMSGPKKILGGAMKLGRQGFLYQGSLLVSGTSPWVLQDRFTSWYSGSNRLLWEDGVLWARE
jgi:lipoate-protein ligase A